MVEIGIYLLSSTFILFRWFDTAFQGCMTSVISLSIAHTSILRFWYLSQTPVLYLQCPYLNLQLDIMLVSQSQYINIEFILSVKNRHPFDYPNFLHLSSPGPLTQNRSFFASPTFPFSPVSNKCPSLINSLSLVSLS